MAQPMPETSRVKRTARKLLLFCIAYITLALACLIQWGGASPWARVDLFSGGFLIMTVAWMWHFADFTRTALRSDDARREFSGVDFDPAAKKKTAKLTMLLPIIDLLIVFDYGHWHLVPLLESRVWQSLRLILYMVSFASLLWVDSYLTQYFTSDRASRNFLSHGPYHYARHPRYAILLAYRVIYALVFASVIGWAMVLVWVFILRGRILVEEAHMRELFGEEYDDYCQRTARLIPAVF